MFISEINFQHTMVQRKIVLTVFTGFQVLIICACLLDIGLGEWNRFFVKEVQPLLKLSNHNFTLISASEDQNNISQLSVAVGLAITTKMAKPSSSSALGITCPFFKSLLPSFCQTASQGYRYKFYLAYDFNDKYFSQASFTKTFMNAFTGHVTENCPGNSSYSIHLVRCNYSGHPAWAQNDAMMDAYLDDVDYYYRVNDDTIMQTARWTEKFINALTNFTPPNIGVVGPKHIGGNGLILTHDFVHKTHMDIFGFYYPRSYKAWYADNWITNIYTPNNSFKLRSVKVFHTMENGQRYNYNQTKYLAVQAKPDKETLHA